MPPEITLTLTPEQFRTLHIYFNRGVMTTPYLTDEESESLDPVEKKLEDVRREMRRHALTR